MNTKRKHDIQFPGIKPGFYQHIAREPNTNYLTQLYQKKNSEDESRRDEEINQYKKDTMLQRYEKHAAKRQFQRLVKEKVQKKIEAYEEEVEKRRKKLRELLGNEERQFYHETVDKAQKYDNLLMEQKKQRLELLRAKREEERLAVVHQKRIEQYRDRCEDLRNSLTKKHLKETKDTQLQQVKEHESRNEAEKELDRMWHNLLMKDMKAKMEREEQEVLREKLKQKELLDTWDKQVNGKRLLKSEIVRMAGEDKLEMEKVQEQLRREEIEALDAKRRKRNQISKDLLDQIAEQESYLEKRRQEEEAYTRAFVEMAEIELEKEKRAVKDFSAQARKETVMYKNYLKELEIERKKEEQELERLLEIHRKEIEKKQDEARCKLVEAKRALQENVLQERAQQIEYKKQEAEQQLELKRAENELLRMAYDQNERLQAESDRLEAEAVKLYRDDLQKQIEYNRILRDRERQELERQLQEGLKEEEKYRKIVAEMLTRNVESNQIHPFKRVLDRSDCYCSNP